ncbi:MAG: hypothetical protein JWQ88_758 [Rhodoferax sp.]|nr:hypothetical protein [Rhodoferax sp.]
MPLRAFLPPSDQHHIDPVHPIWLIILAPLSFLAFPMIVAIPIAILAVLVLFFKHGDHED